MRTPWRSDDFAGPAPLVTPERQGHGLTPFCVQFHRVSMCACLQHGREMDLI